MPLLIQPSVQLYNRPFVSPNQLTQLRLAHFQRLTKESFTVLSPVLSEENIWRTDKFVLASPYLETTERSIPRQSWTQPLNTDDLEEARKDTASSFSLAPLVPLRLFYIGSWQWQSHWYEFWDEGYYPPLRSLTRKSLTCGKSGPVSMKHRGFLAKGGGMDETI